MSQFDATSPLGALRSRSDDAREQENVTSLEEEEFGESFIEAESIPENGEPPATSMLEWALKYAEEEGCPVFPLEPRKKTPLGRLAPRGFKDATTDTDTIRCWWEQEPKANIGIPTGAATFDVMDIDPRNGGEKSFEKLKANYNLPPTIASTTGGGGTHFFFQHSGNRSIGSAEGLLPGIDIKSDGGYIVAPPSVHPSGRLYEWKEGFCPETAELAEQPDWLIRIRRDHRGNRTPRNPKERFDTARALSGVPKGQRDVTLFRLASKLRRVDMPKDIAEELVLKAATNCKPPFPESEALKKVESAYKRYEPEKEELSGIIVTARETFEKQPPRKEPRIETLADAGEIMIVAARPGTGKTPFFSQMAQCLAGGHDFLGLPTHKCSVAVIDLESDPSKYCQMLRYQRQALGIPESAMDNFHLFLRGWTGENNSDELEQVLKESLWGRLKWIDNLVKQHDIGVVLIDTILDFYPIEAKDEDKVRTLFGKLREICRTPPYPLIAFSAHLRKQDQRGKRPQLLNEPRSWCEEILGSVVWASSSDIRVGLEQETKEDEDSTRVVMGGFRRGVGELPPLFLEPHVEVVEDEPKITHWERCCAYELASQILTPALLQRYDKIPHDGAWRSWQELKDCTRASDSTLCRMLEKAKAAGLLEHDTDTKRYHKPVPPAPDTDRQEPPF